MVDLGNSMRSMVFDSSHTLESTQTKKGHRKSFSSATFTGSKGGRASTTNLGRDQKSKVQEGHRRSKSLPKRVGNIFSSPAKHENSETFYVRVSLGSLTGLKIKQLSNKKGKKPNQNCESTYVGYVSLASTGTQVAESQPFSPEGSKSHSKKLVWPGSSQMAESQKRGRLHFSLQLKKESSNSDECRDDTSGLSIASFSPKVVKLEIGLKSGDHKLRLGIATLVVNGRKLETQKMDLAMRPYDMAEEMQRLKKLKPTFFKKEVATSEFEKYSFSLDSNSTLRVHVDTRTGPAGLSKNQVWGDDPSMHTRTFSRSSFLSSSRRRQEEKQNTAAPFEYITFAPEVGTVTSDLTSKHSILLTPACMATSCILNVELCGKLKDSSEQKTKKIAKNEVFGMKKASSTAVSSHRREVSSTSVANSSLEISNDDYEDLIFAKETLRRYADKAGIEVDDILGKIEYEQRE